MAGTGDSSRGADVPARPHGRARPAPQSRQAILGAVEDLLRSRRLDELTVNEIVAAAGISRATFYVHFDTKYSVVAALLEDVVDGILEIWRPLFQGDGPVEEALIREPIAATTQRWRAHAALLSATIEGWHSDPEIHELWGGVMDRFTAALSARIERGAARGGHDADILAAALAALLERSVYLAISTPESPLARSDDAVVAVLSTIWARTLGAAPDA